MKIKVSGRGEEGGEYEVQAVPRIGELLVRGEAFSAARVSDVWHNLYDGTITVEVK